MTKKRALGGISAVALMLLADPALSGGSMKCGIHLIHAGGRHPPSKYEVLKKCGEPTERYGNTWIYEKGSTRRILRFDESRMLATIDSRRN